MPLRTGIAILLLAALAAGCSTTKGGTPTTAARSFPHGARDLEALLPDRVEYVPLEKASRTGAVRFGGNSFSRRMAAFLKARGRKPRSLRSATGVDLSSRLQLEVGVFQVRGLGSGALARAIVAAARPSAPGLRVRHATLAGKPVTTLLYPGSPLLYLYGHGDLVFYVASATPQQAGKILDGFP